MKFTLFEDQVMQFNDARSIRKRPLGTLIDRTGLWDLSYEERAWLESFPNEAASEEAFQALMSARKTELLLEVQEKTRARAATQKARRQAKKSGVTNWQGLMDGVLTVQDMARLERLCALHGWAITVTIWNLGEESKWEFSNHCKGLQLELVSDVVKSVLEQATEENFGLLMELTDYSLEAVTPAYRFRSTEHIKRCIGGYAWLHQAKSQSTGQTTPAVARTLFRLPEDLRWAAIALDAKSTSRWKSDINWQRVRLAKKCPATRFNGLPAHVQWRKLFGFQLPPKVFKQRYSESVHNPYARLIPSLTGLKVSVVRAVCKDVGLSLEEATFSDNSAALSDLSAILKLTSLLRDYEAIKRFVLASGHPWTVKGLHDAGQFNLPSDEKKFTPEKWAPLCLKHPKATAFCGSFGTLEDKNIFPTTLAQLRMEVRGLGYPNSGTEWAALREACLEANVPGSEYSVYEDFWKSNPQKIAEFLPLAKVCGTEVGMDCSWKFYKLSVDDYRGPLLGQLTGCCQHLGGAGKSVARHGVQSPYSGFYVVTHAGKVILQTWAWRTMQGDIVLDSIESIERDEANLKGPFELLHKGMQRIQASVFGIERVFVGSTSSGVTKIFLQHLLNGESEPLEYNSAPRDDCEYFDGSRHILAVGKPPPKRKQKYDWPSIDGYTETKVKRWNGRCLQQELGILNYELPGYGRLFFDRATGQHILFEGQSYYDQIQLPENQ
jgi:hypothetical protein